MPESAETRPRQDSLISATENRAMFDHISGYYDCTNKILSFGLDYRWRRLAVRRLAPQSGKQYMDVGAGTGDIALEILNQEPGARVVGIDPSEGMLEVGRTKVKSRGLEHHITLETGDVLGLRYQDGSFDGAITAFCIRNVTDRSHGLSEIRRVLRPGGTLVILELTEPTGSIMRPLFRIYASMVMPIVTKLLSSVSAYRYLADSMAHFPKPNTVLNLMREAGFVNVNHVHMTGGIVTLFRGERTRSNQWCG